MVVYAAMSVSSYGNPAAFSSPRFFTSQGQEKFSCSRSRHGLKLRSPSSVDSRISCSLQENGHDKLSSINSMDVDAQSPNWTPSNSMTPSLHEREASVLRNNEVIIPNIDNLGEPFMFMPIDKTLERKRLGLTEAIVRQISEENNEPEWMLQFRLDAFQHLLTMEEPQGATCPPIDFHAMFNHSAITSDHQRQSQDIVQDGSEIFESTEDSFAAVHKEALDGTGVIFSSIAEAIQDHPDLVRKYLGKVVPPSDNFYAALNSAIFVDGVFCYVPKNVVCPMDISTYFLVDGRKTSSPFERTLIVCDENAFVSSLGCTSPPPPQAAEITRSAGGQELHAPVIELLCAAGGEIKHVTVQNWLEPGATAASDEAAQEELLCNFVTQRGLCEGARAKITWTIVEAGSGVTWQHPAVVLKGDGSVGECFSVTMTNGRQRADTGATMIHSGSGTRSRIVGKIISAGSSQSCFRGVVHVEPWSRNAKSDVERDAVLIGHHAECTACPSIVARNTSAQIEEKGSTSRINAEQLFFFQQRGIAEAKAVPAILTGFCDSVLRELPHEFESEVTEMVAMKIEEFLHASFA